MDSVTIEIAKTPDQFDAAARLFRAYAAFLNLDLEFQGFSDELRCLTKAYAPPKGAILLAVIQGEVVGAVGLREFEPSVAEMKRMYVLEQYQGAGIGKALTQEFLTHAKNLGYRSVRLDSIRQLEAALTLYRDLGFKEIAPYRYNPHPSAVFMECNI